MDEAPGNLHTVDGTFVGTNLELKYQIYKTSLGESFMYKRSE
jgi:hypothetical protein